MENKVSSAEIYINILQPILERKSFSDFEETMVIKLDEKVANFINKLNRYYDLTFIDELKRMCFNYLNKKYNGTIIVVSFVAHGKGNLLDSIYVRRKVNHDEEIYHMYKQILNNKDNL